MGIREGRASKTIISKAIIRVIGKIVITQIIRANKKKVEMRVPINNPNQSSLNSSQQLMQSYPLRHSNSSKHRLTQRQPIKL